MASRPRPPGAPPSTTSSTPSRPKPTSAPPSQQASSGGVLALDDNTDLISLGSFGSQHQSNENLNQEEAQTANLAALQGASEALRDAQLEKAAAEAKSKIQILTKDEEGRVISDTVLSIVDKSTEEMTAHEMDLFIQTLPIEELFKTFDLDGSGAIDFEDFSKMLPKIGIHIAAFKDAKVAPTVWRYLQSVIPVELTHKNPLLTTISDKNTEYYSLRIGPFSSPNAAKIACLNIQQRQHYCSVVEYKGVLVN